MSMYPVDFWELCSEARRQHDIKGETTMRCVYEIEVRAQCPVEPTDTDLYNFTIESQKLIEVEKITAFFADNAGKKQQFQESLTRLAAVTLGAKVTSVGWHSGVRVTCTAP